MPKPIDELLNRAFTPPPDDDSLPAFLELSSSPFVSLEEASAAQIRLAVRLHREIARRHALQADRLERFASEREN